MQKISINIHVPREAALRSGVVLYGDTTYEPAPEELAELTSEQRLHLMRYEGEATTNRLKLDSYAPHGMWELIVRALKQAIVDHDIEKAAAEARAEIRAQSKADLQAWAARQTLLLDLMQPARDGYDISGSYVTAAAELVRAFDPQLGSIGRPETFNAARFEARVDVEPRPSPRLFALTLDSRLKVLATDLTERLEQRTQLLHHGVVRLSWGPGRAMTAVLFVVGHPAADLRMVVVWPAEEASDDLAQAMADLCSAVDPPPAGA